jgi:hypothetical protein
MDKLVSLALLTLGAQLVPASYAQTPLAPDLEVENASDSNVLRVYAKLPSEHKWGSALPNSVVPAEKTSTVKVLRENNCTYDFRFEFMGGRREEHFKVDVCTHSHIKVGAKS